MNAQEMLRQHVLDELGWEPSVDAAGISVAVSDDVVALTGVVKTYAEKVAAERAAQRVSGVRAVVNDIDVKLRGPHQREDPAIAEAALHALRWNTLLEPDRLRVRVADGWVRLEGTVDRNYQRTAAEDAVQNLVGVMGVTNLIVVQPPAPPPATNVKGRVEAALRRRAELAARDATQVKVETRGDRVILRGTVHSWADRAAAEAAAWGAPGVVAVDDELEVAPLGDGP